MNHTYIIQDENKEACAATFQQSMAVELCQKLGPKTTYRSVPFYSCDGTEIKVVAGPIPREYLPERY
jgi:hypothetical protein